MYEPDFPSLNWRQLAFYVIAAFLGSGVTGSILSLWANRGKRQAEVEHTDANTGALEVETTVKAGDAISRFMDRLEVAQANNDRLRAERDEWADKYYCVEMERDKLESTCGKQAVALDLQDKQIGKLIAILKLSNIRYQDFDFIGGVKRPEELE